MQKKIPMDPVDAVVLSDSLRHRDDACDPTPTPPALVMEIARLCRVSMHRELADYGRVKYTRRAILAHLAERGDATQQQLADVARLAAPTVSIELAKMEEDGLVVRERNEKDGRAITVRLTENGRSLHERIRAHILSDEEIMLRGLTDGDVERVRTLLTVMRNNLLGELTGGDGK